MTIFVFQIFNMFSSVKSIALSGIDGIVTNVEADIRNGLPCFNMVGFLSTKVREAGERVRAAILNSGFYIAPKRILVNISPADIKKDSTSFDLAVAVSILAVELKLDVNYLLKTAFVGELSLNGDVRPVNGVLPMVCAAKDAGIKRFILPSTNVREAKLVDGIEIIPVNSLIEAINIVKNKILRGDTIEEDIERKISNLPDFSEVHGQEGIKRAIEIAVSGMHNILMVGQAGSGKSMLASRIPSIMPPMSADESLEVTKIYSISGLLEEGIGLIEERPFRSPHNSISLPALAGGGGNKIRAGEISLAHNGVLFLDELPEFKSQTIEVLRQPLEEKKITIGRVSATVTYPANFLLAAAMNPCKCGFYPDRRLCHCSELQIKNYLARVSRPLIDRFDIVTEVRRIAFESIFKNRKEPSEVSSEIRNRVCRVRDIQEERFKNLGIHFNSQMDSKMTDEFCKIDSKTRELLETAYKTINLSLRGYYRVLKVARTIADMNGKRNVTEVEVSEAIHYREMIERFWG